MDERNHLESGFFLLSLKYTKSLLLLVWRCRLWFIRRTVDGRLGRRKRRFGRCLTVFYGPHLKRLSLGCALRPTQLQST